jgi:8-oxo-dGTP diphosphatase
MIARVPVLRATALVDVPPRAVLGCLLAPDALRELLGMPVGAEVLCPGAMLALRPELTGPTRLRVERTNTEMVEFTGQRWGDRVLTLSFAVTETAAGTLVTVTCRWRPALGTLFGVSVARCEVLHMLRAVTERLDVVAGRFAARRIVVGAAVVRTGRLLVQRRGYPPWAAGRWELPGGHVEPGETEPAALRRECSEELAVGVNVGQRLGLDVPLPNGRVLRCYVAWLDEPAAEPRAIEHPEVRWVGAAEVAELDWLPADRALLPALKEVLRSTTR